VWQEVSNKETKKTSNSSHHDSAFSDDTTSVARGVKQMKQTKQATHHVTSNSSCHDSALYGEFKVKPETFNIGCRIFHRCMMKIGYPSYMSR
jgi:hypothetical protein